MKLKTKKQVLQALHQVIKDHPERWTQECMARNFLGQSVPYDWEEAFTFCAWGMVRRLYTEGTISQGLYKKFMGTDCVYDLIDANDIKPGNNKPILDKLKKLIAKEK